MKTDNIYLIGFMGVGKSTVSKYLKQMMEWEEIDTDAEIVSREKRSIQEIFEQSGEAYFRSVETALMEELSERSHLIVSCGGGVALREANVEAMRRGGIVIWLQATPETIYHHVRFDRSRPLLNGHMNVEYIAELMKKRESYYASAMTYAVQTDEKKSSQVAEEIVTLVENRA